MKDYEYDKFMIQEAWEEYQDKWCFKYLTAGDGKWHLSETKPDTANVLKLERCKYKSTISFPKYLELKYGG
jgi:hypothetical protein